jgi:hypothetical protein
LKDNKNKPRQPCDISCRHGTVEDCPNQDGSFEANDICPSGLEPEARTPPTFFPTRVPELWEEPKHPAKCPKCDGSLETILEEQSTRILDFCEDTGNYSVEDAQASGTYICETCNQPIGGWRADGEKWGFQPEVIE